MARILRLLSTAWLGPVLLTAQSLVLTPEAPFGVFQPNTPVAWKIETAPPAPLSSDIIHYKILLDGQRVLESGSLDPNAFPSKLILPAEAKPDSGALLAVLTTRASDGSERIDRGAALISPALIAPGTERPADFDAYWDERLRLLRSYPVTIERSIDDHLHPGVRHETLRLDSASGLRAHAQLARPTGPGPFPALIILQWAGVYPLQKNTVVTHAAEGWIALNLMPHDAPPFETEDHYQALRMGELKDYGIQKRDDRDHAYLGHMLMRGVLALDHLTALPEWDGRVLVATGTSKGGYQALALSALDPRISAVAANVPAGCDLATTPDRRAQAWPYWFRNLRVMQSRSSLIETALYLDLVHFAPRIRIPALVSAGLIDTTCPPAGIVAMTNQIKGPVELITMPQAPHQGGGGAHAAYHRRFAEWLVERRL